jgi:DNA mismatch endonuclease (patch repair protein)
MHHLKGWRRFQNFIGKPDFIWRKEKVALFVDGCFWHGCPTCLRLPATNKRYWHNKIARNVIRDREVNRLLRQLGWIVVRIKECKLSSPTIPTKIQRILKSRKILIE